jgi:hypothetical protein
LSGEEEYVDGFGCLGANKQREIEGDDDGFHIRQNLLGQTAVSTQVKRMSSPWNLLEKRRLLVS